MGTYISDTLRDIHVLALDDEGFLWERITVDPNEFMLMRNATFKRHFRLSKASFELLCHELVGHLEAEGGIVRVRRDFRHKVLSVLWILATPDCFRSVALKFGFTPGELHRYYTMIIKALCALGENYITWPDAQERVVIKQNLEAISGFPGAVGLIDGTHIQITRPLDEPAAYRDRHHIYSIQVQGVCDHRLLIRDLYVGEAGSLADARVFRRSPLFRNILYRDDHMFSEGEHIIGDSAYPNIDRLMTPFVNNGRLAQIQRQYNTSLSRIRVKIEHTWGRHTSLWRRSKRMEVYNMEICVDHQAATYVLHNFRIIHDGEIPLVHADDEEDVVQNPLDNVDDGDEYDQLVPQGDGRVLYEQALIRGDQKRWNICNHL
ncbi:Protein ANTAGONIST OF LIKE HETEROCHROMATIN PROTEIN 1 [Frankliniella fusca]|uniref:Protein ANTAGONIST OF LIKE HETEROCHROMATIN PROTEIN 1 n=1 Tax=Frankliniella fusca TaxID=407009 RepID=A0AAE1HME1_9NEOP|nr:Protein ANTAGONIST OF LIKE HETEROCHROMATIN PROTEIN 1 [Frankliniella fusca]